MTVSSQDEVVFYLAKVKRLLADNKYDFVPRKVNLEALAELGWALDYFFKDYLMQLTLLNYVNGPETDRDDYDEDVWVFGDDIETDQYYIKIKIRTHVKQEVVCISFHKAKFPLNFPWK
ncbi:MAG: hypothetical protein PHT79_02035 [Syntrophomonadaceae bacterium]|nr:hypothetical protein [Syntrophomonadaceae bacterium]MDD3888661.1 hypothetical protein [Syntrophomonadaceae bacterium]MDD4548524.1 hypothetical protein [Syntrophomonadaceae bacterium]